MRDNPQLKNLIAQNCDSYNAKVPEHFFRVGISNESCYNCESFVAGQCSKNLYENIESIIKTN